jgi:hypothetical protein
MMHHLAIRTSLVFLLPALANWIATGDTARAQLAGVADIPCVEQGTGSTCSFPKTVVETCSRLPASSIFAQCNIFALPIGNVMTRTDDNGRTFESAIFKYSERNNCSTGDNSPLSLLGRCDTFAAYIQVLRDTETKKCYALVNSALLGVQLKDDVHRNNPNKIVQKLEVPGVSRRITFTQMRRSPFHDQPNAVLITTDDPKRSFIRSGPAISALSVLQLENTLTVKPENLKANPAKIRLTRGVGTSSDFLDFPLGRREESALNSILSNCQ